MAVKRVLGDAVLLVVDEGERCVSEGRPARRLLWSYVVDRVADGDANRLLVEVRQVSEENAFGLETQDGRKYLVIDEDSAMFVARGR